MCAWRHTGDVPAVRLHIPTSGCANREQNVNFLTFFKALKSEQFTLSLETEGPQLSKTVREAISCTTQGITSPKTGVGPSYEEKTVFKKLNFTSI